MTQQADLTTGRQFAITASARAAAPTNKVTAPDFIMGPTSATGLKTTGVMFMLQAPTAGAAVATVPATGFDVTLWIQNPVTGSWGSSETVSVPYAAMFSTFDFDAAALYVQIGAASVAVDGVIYVEMMEQ